MTLHQLLVLAEQQRIAAGANGPRDPGHGRPGPLTGDAADLLSLASMPIT